MAKQYTDAEKAEYYKGLYREAKTGSARGPVKKGKSYYARKPYRVKANKRNYKKRTGFASNFGTTFGSTVGAAMGGPVGSALGAVVGGGADMLTRWISGSGDYRISGNSYITGRDPVPKFTSANPRCTMVVHKEYIKDIYSGPTITAGATNFHTESFAINPANIQTFPWLSALAQNYEQYVVQGMIFEYKSNSANAIGSTNTALGTVIMATQYNSLAPQFSNKQQMENHEFAQSTTPSLNAIHPIECDPAQTQCGGIFNTSAPGQLPGDKRLYDIGEFTIATQGMQAAGVCLGELWVSYKICFLKPRLTAPSDLWDHYDFDPTSLSTGSPFGLIDNISKAQTNSTFTRLGANGSNGYIDIQPGYIGYIGVVYSVYAGDSLNRPPMFQAASGSTGIGPLSIFNNQGDTTVPNRYSYGGTQASGLGGQTFCVCQCTGTNNMRLVSFNQALTQTDRPFSFASLDVFSIGQNVFGPMVPYEDSPFMKMAMLSLGEEEKPVEDSTPDPVYEEDWQVIKDRQINMAMPSQRTPIGTPQRPY